MAVVLRAAEAISQAADLGNDQVDEGVDQLVEDLQVFVLFEAAETLSEDTNRKCSGPNTPTQHQPSDSSHVLVCHRGQSEALMNSVLK